MIESKEIDHPVEDSRIIRKAKGKMKERLLAAGGVGTSTPCGHHKHAQGRRETTMLRAVYDCLIGWTLTAQGMHARSMLLLFCLSSRSA